MEELTESYLSVPRSARDLMRRDGIHTGVTSMLQSLRKFGRDVMVGTGWDDGLRQFYWLSPKRDSVRLERAIGRYDMYDIRVLSPGMEGRNA